MTILGRDELASRCFHIVVMHKLQNVSEYRSKNVEVSEFEVERERNEK